MNLKIFGLAVLLSLPVCNIISEPLSCGDPQKSVARNDATDATKVSPLTIFDPKEG